MRKVKLKDIAEINPRKSEIDKDEVDEVCFVAMADVSEDGFISEHETRHLSEVYSGYTYFKKNDVLLAKITPCFENGKAAIADNIPHDIGFGSSEFHVLRTNGKVLPKYLFYALWNEPFREHGCRKMTGSAGQKRVPTNFLKNYEIPLPNLDEQKAIVAKLDRAQRLIDIDKDMLAKYDQLIQSVFLEMFGDPVKNPKGWEVQKFGDVVEKLIAGKSFKSTDDDSGNYRVIKTGAVSWNRFDKSESKALPPDYEPPREHFINKGDILISRMNTSELVGASVLIQDEIENYTIPDRIWKVKWKSKGSQTQNYFWHCINHDSFRNEISKIATGTSGSMKNMSKKKMFNMDVILPPIELQEEFDDICNKIDSQKNELYESHKKSEELFSSLAQEVFG